LNLCSFRLAVPIVSLLFITLQGFTQQLHFENFSSEQGLSDKVVLSIGQDERGCIWLGTYKGGITKYNGVGFEKIGDKDGLPSNLIYSLTRPDQHRMIAGTDQGIAVFDGKKFSNYSKDNGLPDETVFSGLFDSGNTLWLGTGKGVCTFSEHQFKAFTADSALSNATVFTIYEDSRKQIWFCTAHKGLFCYDGKTMRRYQAKNGLDCEVVYSVIEISDKVYWILTENNLFELRENKLQIVKIDAIKGGAFFYCSLKDRRDGTIWIGTDQGVLNYRKGKFNLLTVKNGLVDNTIWKIFQDRENNLWFASKQNGVSRLSSERFLSVTTNEGLPKNEIKGILLQDSKTFVLTASGLSELDNGKLVKNAIVPKLLLQGDLTSFISDKKSFLMASEYGVNRFDGINYDTLRSNANKNLDKCYCIMRDSKGTTWLGTFGGLAQLENNRILPYSRLQLSKPVKCLMEDRQKRIWIGTDYGLYLLSENNLIHFSLQEGMPEKIVQAFFEDKMGTVFIATESGLFRQKKNQKDFTRISDRKDFNSNDITSVTVDTWGYIWAGATNGLNRIKMEHDSVAEIRHFDAADGFTGESCNAGVMTADSATGQIWIGTNNGLLIYNRDLDFENKCRPITNITDIKINGSAKEWAEGKILVLPYTQNNFIFSFIGVSLTAPQKVSYRYRLKGFDKDWMATTELQVPYPNLEPGTYEFQVKACTNEGIWNTEPVCFAFRIESPFYQTWWFYSICILIAIGGVFSYIKIKRSNVEILKQQSIIQGKNQELEKANREIAQYNKNITDSITYAKRIQEAILPAHKRIKQYLKDFFILYKPKDIVSGDFYWFDHLNHKSLIAAVDCTGHGVPGALVSMVGHNGLTRVINEFALTQPGAILDKLNSLVEETLRQNDKTAVRDGMDISLLMIDSANSQLNFAGANNGMYLLRKKNRKLIDNGKEILPSLTGNEFCLFEIKPDKQPIGSESEMNSNFTNHIIPIESGDLLYLFTDGFADQFGGSRGKKFLYKPFKQLLLDVSALPMQEQKKAIYKSLKAWMGSLEQVDDVCVIGIRLS